MDCYLNELLYHRKKRTLHVKIQKNKNVNRKKNIKCQKILVEILPIFLQLVYIFHKGFLNNFKSLFIFVQLLISLSLCI